MANLEKITPQELNNWAKEQAEIFVREDKLKTHQLRNIFSAIEKMRSQFRKKKKFDAEIEMQLILLKPKIAYAAGRQRSVKDHFFPFMEKAIQGVEDSADKDLAIRNFFALIESVVGYHRFYESNKN